MRAFLFLLTLATAGVAATVACGGEDATPCTSWQDCQDSAEAEALRPCDNGGQGAVIHVDTACVRGRCRAECASTCIPYGCSTPGAVCETPAPTRSISPSNVVRSCTKNPIACTTAADCPLEQPRSATSAGEWSCESGVCRYPGFTYAFE